MNAASAIPIRVAGFSRIPGFMAVAAYDDEWFLEYVFGDQLGEILLLEYELRGDGDEGQSRRFRQAVFNIGHFTDRRAARQWNEFVAAKQAQLARCPPAG
jgi:hypothetical protein